jgi:hypothetical protein
MDWTSTLAGTGGMPTLDTRFGFYEKFVMRSFLLSWLTGRSNEGRFRATEEFPKARLGAMSPAQIAAGFRRLFGCLPPAGLAGRPQVSPGDLAVARKARVLRLTVPAEIARMLAAELASKPGAAARIGFVS